MDNISNALAIREQMKSLVFLVVQEQLILRPGKIGSQFFFNWVGVIPCGHPQSEQAILGQLPVIELLQFRWLSKSVVLNLCF